MARKPRRPRKPGTYKNTNFHPESVGDYDTGYGRPPEHTQWVQGQSGNQTGRTIGSKNKPKAPGEVANIILAAGARVIALTEDGVAKTASVTETVAAMLGRRALSGERRAQTDYLKLQIAAEKDVQADKTRRYQTMRYYVDEMRRIQADRYEEGLAPRKFALHPDDVIFDHENETFHINLLNDEQFDVGKALATLLEWEQCEFNHLINEFELAKTSKDLFRLRKEIVSAFNFIKTLQCSLGMPWTTEAPEGQPDLTVLSRLKTK